MNVKHWKSIVALAVMPFAFYFNLVEFYFAVLFLIWSIFGLMSGTTFLLDDNITLSKSPILYWIVTVTWFALALLSLAFSEPVMKLYNA